MLQVPGPKPQTFSWRSNEYVIQTNVLCGDNVDLIAAAIAETKAVGGDKVTDNEVLLTLEDRQYLQLWLRLSVKPEIDAIQAKQMYAELSVFELQQKLVRASGIEELGNSSGPSQNQQLEQLLSLLTNLGQLKNSGVPLPQLSTGHQPLSGSSAPTPSPSTAEPSPV